MDARFAPRASRFEILPFGGATAAALELAEPVTITVTCSPRHGIDRTVEIAARLAAHGHDAVVHLAARQVLGPGHLDELAEQMGEAGIRDVFVIGGDVTEPAGPYDSALPVLEMLNDHRRRPARLGIGAYPEGHPLISPPTLRHALAEKAKLADYAVTQICFDPNHLLAWISELRTSGISVPLFAGVPGAVDRKRLLEISMRVGVGPSISFLRKQKGLRRLLSSPLQAAHRLHRAIAPWLGDPALGLAGLHWYTFNRLAQTIRLEKSELGAVFDDEASEGQ
ncbi:methylenetetrahydrofolate reductase [Amycolatopsis pithecellobii]|uniref:Methylenetetrahydrofolate reductase n=1 Tax=Amycolatopsis pithecellobii TaxID=664692 RepID=A0A6N7YTW4_9PSEU|nr:methylenetetrahydrofolate reductase [Amycolatopsis pithecellobii]MTD56487.1 5,10-methylenetetrahydrofolate reductase [Amycolatopsis pithecellobii]